LKVELEPADWQVLLTLAGSGYQGVCARVAEQLNIGQPPQPQPSSAAGVVGNGEDRSGAAEPRQ
jgi:hypothetical protein